jgi:hypothetical protein
MYTVFALTLSYTAVVSDSTYFCSSLSFCELTLLFSYGYIGSVTGWKLLFIGL